MAPDPATRRDFLRRSLGLALCLAGSMLLSGCPIRSSTPTRSPLVGYLDLANTPPASLDAFRAKLRELGYVEGQSIAIEERYAKGDVEALDRRAEELVGLNPDVIVAFGTQASLAARRATATIPIVMSGSDPEGSKLADGTRLVESLARPGGNVTGLASGAPQVIAKRLELLKELVPNVSQVGFVWNSKSEGDQLERNEIEEAAQSLGVQLISLDVTSVDEFETAFQRAADEQAEAILAFASSLINTHTKRVVDFAEQRRLPAIYPIRESVEAGGLISYGPDFDERYGRAAVFVDKILRGAQPAELPIERPRRFKLILNLRTAQQLAITIPRTIRAQVDEVLGLPFS